MSSLIQRIGDLLGNGVKLSSDGLLLQGSAMKEDDVYPCSVDPGSGANAPAFTAYNGNMKAWEFVGTGPTPKELQLQYQMPHQREDGTDVGPHLHLFVPNNATGGNIRFGMEYTWSNFGDTEPATTTIYGDLEIPANAGNLANARLSFPDLAGTGKTYSSVIACRIFRDPGAAEDTFGASCFLKSPDIHVIKSRLGQ